MLLKTPLRKISNNLLLTKTGDVWAFYRIAPININSGDSQKKEEYKRQFRYFVEQLEKYQDIHLEMLPRQMELEKRNQELEKDFDKSTAKIGHYYNKETARILTRELHQITRDAFYLGVKLKTNIFEQDDTKSMIRNSISSVTDTILQLFNLTRDIGDDFFAHFEEIEKELYQLVISMNGARLTEDELVYINRYSVIHDMQHVIEEESNKRGILNIMDGIIDPTHPGFLKVITPDGKRWLSYVVVNQFGLDMSYTHIFERAQNFSFPLELHVKAQFKSKERVLRKTAMVKTRMKQMTKEKRSTGDDIEDSVKDSRYVLNRLENQLNGGNQKFLEWVAVFVISGESKEECKRRVKQVKRSLGRSQIECIQPSADQLALFYKFLLGQPLQFEKNWIQQTTAVGFAEILFGISQQVGNNIGFYLGRTSRYLKNNTIREAVAGSRDLVLFHPFIANKGIEGAMTDSPHISITGETGKGKSFLVKLLLMFLAMLKVKTLYIDPKSELEVWFKKAIKDPDIRNKYPLYVKLLESFHYVTLNPNEEVNHGVLDPIVMLEGTDAKDTAQAVIEQIYYLDDKDDVKRVLLKTLVEVIEESARGEKVGFMHVIERMKKHPEKAIHDAGELLFEQIRNSALQLIFSYGDKEGLNLNSKVNILGVEGLDLPDANLDPRYYTDGERKSLALMIPLAKFCELFGSKDKNQETVEIFDEGWMLKVARAGKKLIKSMRRVGRSYNNALVLVTQSVKDVNTEDDNGNFGVNFAFDEKSEREDILKFLNLEQTASNEELLANMIKGECLFKDIYGRTGKLAVDCLFEEWKVTFKTVEETNSSRAEKMFF